MSHRGRQRRRSRQRAKQQRIKHAFSYAAGRLGLSLGRGVLGYKLDREVRGHRVGYSQSGGMEEAPGYSCKVRYIDGPLGIKLSIQGRMKWASRSESGPRLRRSSVATGDESFDASWLIRTSEPDRLLLVLDERVRKTILKLASEGKLQITDKQISLKEPLNANPDGGMIVQRVRGLVSLAEALEKSRT